MSHRPPTSPLINEQYSFTTENESSVDADTSQSRTSDADDRSTSSGRPEAHRNDVARGGGRMVDSKSTQTDPMVAEILAQDKTPRLTHQPSLSSVRASCKESSRALASQETTPQLRPPFSPGNQSVSSDNGALLSDSRTGMLITLLEHVSKILNRLRHADVISLTRRLQKQHLKGDVGHVSQSELKSLSQEVNDIRAQFRTAMEEERRVSKNGNLGASVALSTGSDSRVSSKDFNFLLRVFKDILVELIDLRGIVNDVTMNPDVAKDLRRNQMAVTQEKAKEPKADLGLGWIPASLTKFVRTSTEPLISTTEQAKSKQPQHTLPPAARRPTKLMPSISATTTEVSVEFARSSGKLLAKPAPAQTNNAEPALDVMEHLPASPADTLTRFGGKLGAASTKGSHLAGRSAGAPLGRQTMFGTFSGGRTAGGEDRKQESYLNRSRSVSTKHRRRLSTVVDAVIDTQGPEIGAEEEEEEEDDDVVVQRPRRPRGLSDSSIHTTFQQHGVIVPAVQGPDSSHDTFSYSSYWPSTNAVNTFFGKRIQALTGSTTTGPTDTPPQSGHATDPDLSTTTMSATDTSHASLNSVHIQTPQQQQPPSRESAHTALAPRTIVKKNSASQLGLVSPASMTGSGGFLGMLSTSASFQQI